MSDDLREPLTSSGGGGDDASQTSQRSSASLLERIRAQRAAASPSTAPTTIQVPQYNPVAREEFASAGPAGEQGGGGGSFFTDAWTNISHSMETGMASLSQEVGGVESDEALLAPSAGDVYNEENYSMVDYFTTFVKDVYGTFLNLPLLVRVTVIFALLFTAFKLM
jgi:hypothetical protein